MATASDPSKKSSATDGKGSNQDPLSGLRFNQTGREESAREVLKPQLDPSAAKRRTAIIAAVVVGVIALGVLTVKNSNLKWDDVFGEHKDGPQFAAPQAGPQ